MKCPYCSVELDVLACAECGREFDEEQEKWQLFWHLKKELGVRNSGCLTYQKQPNPPKTS